MLHRSPTYMISFPDEDFIANALRKALPDRGATNWNGRPIGEVLLEPTRIYVKSVLALIEACDVGAIRFRLAIGGRAVPTLDNAACSGCGACIAVCPEKAIHIGKNP